MRFAVFLFKGERHEYGNEVKVSLVNVWEEVHEKRDKNSFSLLGRSVSYQIPYNNESIHSKTTMYFHF